MVFVKRLRHNQLAVHMEFTWIPWAGHGFHSLRT
jgi:hypothetical protein